MLFAWQKVQQSYKLRKKMSLQKVMNWHIWLDFVWYFISYWSPFLEFIWDLKMNMVPEGYGVTDFVILKLLPKIIKIIV